MTAQEKQEFLADIKKIRSFLLETKDKQRNKNFAVNALYILEAKISKVDADVEHEE